MRQRPSLSSLEERPRPTSSLPDSANRLRLAPRGGGDKKEPRMNVVARGKKLFVMKRRYRRSIHNRLFECDVLSVNPGNSPFIFFNTKYPAKCRLPNIETRLLVLPLWKTPPLPFPPKETSASSESKDTYSLHKISNIYSKVPNQYNALYLHWFYRILVSQDKNRCEINFHKIPKYFLKCRKVFHFIRHDYLLCPI